MATFMYKYINKLLPPLFSNIFLRNDQIHTYSTRKAADLRSHTCRTNLKKFTILYLGPKIWNELPSDIKHVPTIMQFSKKLKNHFFNIHNY